MNIFISHTTSEQQLAEAWKKLLENLPANTFDVFFSSDSDPDDGLQVGRWRQQVETQLQRADLILALLTPASVNKSWIAFESGLALGQGKTITPIPYFMKMEQVPSILNDQQAYRGDDAGSVALLCRKLIPDDGAYRLDDDLLQFLVDRYMKAVEAEHAAQHATFFDDTFHNTQTAERLAGTWHAKWTAYQEGGPESVFSLDTFNLMPTSHRIRLHAEKPDKKSRVLMEGVVSWRGQVALTYWFSDDVSICGTILMHPVGARLDTFEGTWESFTVRSLDEEPRYTRGRIIMARDEAVARDRWALHPDGAALR